MAMTDFFKKNACEKITQTKTANDYGQKIVSDALSGVKFDGLLVRPTISEMVIGADRTAVNNRYVLFVYADAELAKDDKVCYTYRDGQKAFLRLTSGAILNEDASGQTAWKTFEVETYEPTGDLS